jgi:hypothetical protein
MDQGRPRAAWTLPTSGSWSLQEQPGPPLRYFCPTQPFPSWLERPDKINGTTVLHWNFWPTQPFFICINIIPTMRSGVWGHTRWYFGTFLAKNTYKLCRDTMCSKSALVVDEKLDVAHPWNQQARHSMSTASMQNDEIFVIAVWTPRGFRWRGVSLQDDSVNMDSRSALTQLTRSLTLCRLSGRGWNTPSQHT